MHFHVFPEGRLCSMRRALLLWLVPMFVLVGGVSAACAYWSYNHMVAAFMDDQMSLLAESVSAQEQDALLPKVSPRRVREWGAYVVQIHGSDGRILSSTLAGVNLPLPEETGFRNIEKDGARWRVYTSQARETTGRRQVQVAQSREFRIHLAAERAGAALAPLAVLLPLLMLAMWGVAAAMSRALRDIAQQAAEQDENNIQELSLTRVPEEITPLVISFNSLLTRLRDAFANQRRFVQDAAHELRTPIAAIGLQLENLRGDIAPGAPAQRFGQLEAGVHRAQRLVDQLMRLSRQEAARSEAPPAPVDVQALIRESINALIVLADQRNIDLGMEAEPNATDKLVLTCQASDLRSALDNLIDNALRYTPEGGVIDVRVKNDGGRLVIEVADTGPGIPQELLPRVFDRFFRVPGTEVRGSGLGLSIAKSAAQRCGLRISLRNREDRGGLIARIEPA